MVLRFDYSGIGDSARRNDDLPRPEGVLRETREALAFLAESHGAQQFIPMGLCWGATNAFRIACDDRRVVGAVMLDWCAYRTLGYYLRRYGRRLFELTPYYNFLTGRNPAGRGLRRMLGIGGVQPLGNPIGVSYVRQFPPKQVVAGELRGLTDRGVDLLFIYSAGQEDLYNYRRQFEDTFPWLRSNEQVRVEFFGGADHTFTLLRYQDVLISVIEDFARTVLARLDTGVPGDAARDCGFSGTQTTMVRTRR